MWDLGKLLGMPPVAQAWVLMRIPSRTGDIPVALRTGACLVVQPVGRLTPLPAGLFQARPGAIPAAFDARAVRGLPSSAHVGVWLDPSRLLGGRDLEASQRALEDETKARRG